ncbi:MAG TPA: Hsp20/alpha crystallin family protein [Planctomycetaceae bacterium]|jgi:HSP20 family molecular chaperone IbpA|nr:Hsp20/alpha crystallin family protein [Planctomycetaceae bacterium]
MNQRQASEGGNGAGERPVYRPAVDIVDAPNEMVVLADVPGVDETHLDITLDKNVLTIRGTVEPPAFEEHTSLRTEFGVGDFERTFTLSDDVSREGIEASVKDGVLQLKLPKTARSARQKINVVAR